MRKILALLLIGSLLFSFGCSDDDSGTEYESGIKIIMPLAIGNHWSYYNYILDTLGNLHDTTLQDLNIYKDTVIESVHWYITTDEYPYKVGSLLANKDDGLWVYGSTPYLIIKYPAEVYDTWSAPGGAYTYSLLAKGVIIIVPEGTFSCYKYLSRASESEDSTLLYYAPGYGMIKSHFWPDDGTKNELITELYDMVITR